MAEYPFPEDEDQLEGGPGEADHDLSEDYGWDWEPRPSLWPPPRWVFVAVSLLVILALVLPSLLLIASR